MAQRVRSVENLPEEVADLAEVAARLIEADPANRQAFRTLANVLDFTVSGEAAELTGAPVFATTTMPTAVATFATMLSDLTATLTTGALPESEQQLWEEAGASFDAEAVEQDAINAATAFADLVVRSIEGDSAVAEFLSVDRSRVSQRIRQRSLYTFGFGDSRYYPRWQFETGGTLPGLKDVLAVIDETLHPLVVDHWFVTPSVDLEVDGTAVSPVTWLATGGTPSVAAELARDL